MIIVCDIRFFLNCLNNNHLYCHNLSNFARSCRIVHPEKPIYLNIWLIDFFTFPFPPSLTLQVDVLNQNVKLAANFLARCPSCMANLVRHMCDFTCSPQQSKFMEIKATEMNTDTSKFFFWGEFCRLDINKPYSLFSEKEYITNIDLHITGQYMNGTYDSCSAVSSPSTGRRALDLMCGSWGASKCSARKWFTYMGTTEGNPYVPFQINYIEHDEPTVPAAEEQELVPLNPRVVPCSEKLDVSF